MYYDVVPLKGYYRGVGRLLLATDLYTKESKKEYDALLARYYAYLSIVMDQPPSRDGLVQLIDSYRAFSQYGVPCEVIAYDDRPMETAFGYALDFLGIDVVHEMSESLLEDPTSEEVKTYLNQNGLCADVAHVPQIVKLCDHGDVAWKPCWVYSVLE